MSNSLPMMKLTTKINDETISEYSWITAMSAKLPTSPFVRNFMKSQISRYGLFDNILFYGAGRGRNIPIAFENEISKIYAYDLNFPKLESKIPPHLRDYFYNNAALQEMNELDLVTCLFVFNTITKTHQEKLVKDLVQLNANTYIIAVRNDVKASAMTYGDGYISRLYTDGSHTYQENFTLEKINALLKPHFPEGYDWYGDEVKGALTLIISRSPIVGMELID
ncbi:hypothetical protein LCGC14_0175590 [marine sediment metagenome]|uniref:Methyltransferase type 11 domain-containing protein n=1 Tax=marine sediment metagenome TaxID=412755 RepID=A0A0F9URC5_9ZZZZ